jgi:hypothetical protein
MIDQRLYDRRATLIVGARRFDGPGRSPTGAYVPGFRISFEVIQAIKAETNSAKAVISNLSETSRAFFNSPLKRIPFQIEAGYSPAPAVLFSGEATHTSSVRQSTGYETHISAQDGLQAKRGIVEASLAPRATMGQTIKTIAEAMGVGASRALARASRGDFDGALSSFFSGVTLSGPADKALDALAESTGFDWAIVNGELVILKPGDVVDEELVILSPSSGLIDSPERKDDEKRPGKLIVLGRSLLNARLTLGRRVRFESVELSGDFRIERVKHSGDTEGQDWRSEIEAVEL